MNKALKIVCLIAVLFLAVPSAFAGVSQTGLTVTFTVANVAGADEDKPFTFKTSPNVFIAAATTATNYGIITTNGNTDKNNGQEFGVLNTSSGYAVRAKTIDINTAPTAPTATTLTGDGWGWMGGS
jgi:hypothetical protein